jgi:hypothetical protein
MSKLYRVGNLYTTRTLQPAGNYAAAAKTCSRLRSKKHGRLRKWRMAKSSEVKKFKSSGIRKTKYWAKASSKSGETAPAVNLSFDKVAQESRANPRPRAFCVSTK